MYIKNSAVGILMAEFFHLIFNITRKFIVGDFFITLLMSMKYIFVPYFQSYGQIICNTDFATAFL